MSIFSEKFSRFPQVECEDLECHDTLDTDMRDYSWKTSDKEFLDYLAENDYSVNPFYLNSMQTFITTCMRSLLLDWIVEICSEFYLKRETCHKAISYVDRFLSVSAPVRKEHLQLLGLTACYIAAKVEEISIPRITDFTKSAGNIYTPNDIKVMERQLLKTLKWKILQPTSYTIIDWLMSQWDSYIFITIGVDSQHIKLKDMRGYKKHREMTQLIDASILDIGILKYKPKTIAASACYLVLFKCFKDQKYALLNKGVYCEDYENDYANVFMDLYLNFVCGALEIQRFDELYPCGLFLSQFMDIPISYEPPTICRTGLKPEAHYQEFLGFQTYNPGCIQFLHAKTASNL